MQARQNKRRNHWFNKKENMDVLNDAPMIGNTTPKPVQAGSMQALKPANVATELYTTLLHAAQRTVHYSYCSTAYCTLLAHSVYLRSAAVYSDCTLLLRNKCEQLRWAGLAPNEKGEAQVFGKETENFDFRLSSLSLSLSLSLPLSLTERKSRSHMRRANVRNKVEKDKRK